MNPFRRGPGLGRRLAGNTLQAASGRLLGLLVWLVFTPPMLHALGAERFAVWSLFYALTGYFAALDFGLVQGTLRHVAAARERGDHGEAGAFATLAVLGFMVLGVIWLTLTMLLNHAVLNWLRIPPAVVADARFAMIAGAGVFVLGGFANILMTVAQGYGRFDLANGILIAATLQQAIGFAVVLQRGLSLRGLVVSVALGWVIAAALGAFLVHRAIPVFRWRSPGASLARFSEAMRFGGPMQITNLLATLNAHVDKLLLSRLVALATVVPYELGVRVASSVLTLPQLILLAVLPEAAALHASGDSARLRELFDRGTRYLLTSAVLVLAPLLGAADRIYAVWLGPGHADAAWALRGLAIAAGFSLATGMGTTVARGIGRTSLEAWYAVVAVALHVTLSLQLLPRLGFKGALIAIAIGNLIGGLLFMLLLARTVRWSFWGAMLGPCVVPVIATVLGAGSGWCIDRWLPAGSGVQGWATLAAISLVAALVAFGVTIVTRYFRWREAYSLIVRRA